MAWRFLSLSFFILGIVCLPVWPYSSSWRFYSTAFCWFLAVLTFLVSIFAHRGSSVWKHKGQG